MFHINLNFLLFTEDEGAWSWTVAEASLVLRIPPQEMMWFGWRDLPEVDPTSCFIATLPVTRLFYF